MRLSQANSPKGASSSKKELKGAAASGSSEKLKASNFPATILRIGTREYKSRYGGDLVAKCYFAKHKLVREVLDGGLKNKIEIQWSDIMALKANYPDDGPGTLDVMAFCCKCGIKIRSFRNSFRTESRLNLLRELRKTLKHFYIKRSLKSSS
ncbi:uncharacterized protein [Coffea arabica]|uniref:Uncharacterized protein isoform X1 n=1 Tax=Coffea arabica TaxID=13443 RepID=A0ABM4W3K3_COFAR